MNVGLSDPIGGLPLLDRSVHVSDKGVQLGQGDVAGYRRIARRTALLFALGLLSNNVLKFDWSNLRVTGVLQRIAVCYGIAAVLSRKTSTR